MAEFEISNDLHRGEKSYLSCKKSDGQPCPSCMSLLAIDQEIDEAERLLAKLMIKRQSTKSLVNQSHDSIIDRLPLEIASHIFTLSIPTIDGHPITYEKSMLCAPLTLGAVCGKWRQIAWSTPHLWTKIDINLLPGKFPQRGQLAQEWLSRSGHLPLSLHLYFYDFPNTMKEQSEPVFYPLIELVNQYSHRWCSLDLELPYSLLSRFSRDSHSSTILHSLQLKLSYDPWRELGQDNRFSMDNLQASPKKVVLSGVPLNAVKIEWNNVMHLEAELLDIDEFIELLRRARQMVHFGLGQSIGSQKTATTSESIIIHPPLQSLSFSGPGLDKLGLTFLGSMSCPGLTSFSYHNGGRAKLTDTVISFLLRSGCSLRHLSIEACPSNAASFVRLLKTTPTLQHLSLQYSRLPILYLFLQLLRTPNAIQGNNPDVEDPLLPDFRSFTYTGAFKFSWEKILAFYYPETLPASSMHSPSTTTPNNSSRRHLPFLSMRVDDDRLEEIYMKKDTLLQFMRLRKEGIKFEFVRVRGALDIIKASKAFHGVSEDND
ncbi:hypothetical protein BDZ97DRAFT_83541 [Flammula alnicola]|nr:hypothetical protein BDZ97DRAFT_83541 [Flammula alnicola]